MLWLIKQNIGIGIMKLRMDQLKCYLIQTILVNLKNNANAPTKVIRSTRVRQVPKNLNDYLIMPDSIVDSKGELVHYALMAEAETISFE